MIIDILVAVFTFIIAELFELYSVEKQVDLKLTKSNHLIQTLVIQEASANERLIYGLNLLFGVPGLVVIYWATTPLFKISIILFLIVSIALNVCLFLGINKINGIIDYHFNRKWIREHHLAIQQSAKEK